MDNKVISEKLRKLRGNKSQREIAEVIGVATSTYGMYEAGERTPSDEVKIRIANHYKKSVQSIFFSK